MGCAGCGCGGGGGVDLWVCARDVPEENRGHYSIRGRRGSPSRLLSKFKDSDRGCQFRRANSPILVRELPGDLRGLLIKPGHGIGLLSATSRILGSILIARPVEIESNKQEFGGVLIGTAIAAGVVAPSCGLASQTSKGKGGLMNSI